MNKNICSLLWMGLFVCCSPASDIEKFQGKRDNVVNVKEQIKEIDTEEILISNIAWTYLIDGYLIVCDYKSLNKMIHLFDRTNYRYITSAANRGQGPGEIVNIGHIGIDEPNRRFFVLDHGKYKMFEYELDSVLMKSEYKPTEKMNLAKAGFPISYKYISDTLSYGVILEPIGNSDFKLCVARWNMNSGQITPMNYTHPEIERKMIALDVSPEYGIYVEGYHHHDLMTICTLDGELKCNIYGNRWNNKASNRFSFYTNVLFCGDKILATYAEGKERGDVLSYPTRLLVFDIEGNYIKTLDAGYRIVTCSYDKKNNRLIMICDDEIQLAYLDLGELI